MGELLVLVFGSLLALGILMIPVGLYAWWARRSERERLPPSGP